MARQLDAFEYGLADGTTAMIYLLLDDVTRFDVGTTAYLRHENSANAKETMQAAIGLHVVPGELLWR